MNRILYVVESLFAFGPAQSLPRLAQELASHDCEIHVAVLQYREMDASPLKEYPIEIHPLGETRCGHPFSRASMQSIYRLQKLTRSLLPDVIHSWCGMSEWVTLAATDLSLPGRRSAARRFATELSLQPEKRLSRRFYENRISAGFEKIAVPHELVKAHLIDNGQDAEKIEIIPNTFQTLNVERAAARELILPKLGLPPDTRVAGTVAPLVTRTRLKDLVFAIDLLSVGFDDCHLLVIGEGNQRSRLERFTSLMDPSDHVHFLAEPEDAAEVLACLDFYWHSHLTEPLPANMLTAMASGIPTISVFGPGTSEIIRHQETGFAVNFGARDEFARWTKYLFEIPDQAAKLSQQGQAFVQQNFGNSTIAESYLKMYGW